MTAKNLLSGVLIAGGACLLYVGGRDLFDSRLGQAEAARSFEQPIPDTPETRAATQPATQYSVNRGDTLAKLKIPRLDAELYVVEGDGHRELRRGPGHLVGTALPGGNGNCVVGGHGDTHFRVVKDIRAGADCILQTAAGQFLCRVRGTRIVSPEDTSA